jgi:hypothetical protein
MQRFERYPLARVAAPRRKRAFAASLVLTIALSIAISLLGAALFGPAAPSGIVSFEVAGTAVVARNILDAWGPAGIAAARQQTLLDFVYLLAYGLTLVLGNGLAVWVWARRSVTMGWLGVVLSWGGLAAALLDAAENIAMLAQFAAGADDTLASVARACANVKFALILSGMIYMMFGAALALTDRVIGVGKLWYRTVVEDDANAAGSEPRA